MSELRRGLGGGAASSAAGAPGAPGIIDLRRLATAALASGGGPPASGAAAKPRPLPAFRSDGMKTRPSHVSSVRSNGWPSGIFS